MVKNLPAIQETKETETWVPSLSQEYLLEEETATHSSNLAWEIPWTEEPSGLQSMGFSRQEYWCRLPCPPLGDLSDPGIELKALMSPSLAGRFFTTSATWEAHQFSSVQPLSRV